VRRSDLGLRLLAVAIAVALFLVVRGERRVTTTFALPLAPAFPAGLAPATPLPGEVSVSLSGPWARLRTLDPGSLGAVHVDLTRAGAGITAWYARPEGLRLPRGVHVDAVHPAQGSVELRRGASD
jgi:hypothetical protein